MRSVGLSARDILPEPSADAVSDFSPEAFFAAPWWGAGVVLLFGLPVGRYEVGGSGQAVAEGHVFEQRFRYQNGFVKEARWLVSRTDDGAYRATDLISGLHARGRQLGPEFEWSFAARTRTPFGVRLVHTVVRYRKTSPRTVVSTLTSRILGVPMLRMTTYYGRPGEAPVG